LEIVDASVAMPARRRSRGDHLVVGRCEVQHAVVLQPRKQRVAVPRLEDVGDRRRPWRRLRPDDAEPEERRDDREPQPVALGDEVLDGGQHAVARPTLAPRRVAVRQASRADALDAREQPRPLLDRLQVLGRDEARVVVVVAARVRPADVVEDQQRQLAAG
jgi:hypothetical protein